MYEKYIDYLNNVLVKIFQYQYFHRFSIKIDVTRVFQWFNGVFNFCLNLFN